MGGGGGGLLIYAGDFTSASPSKPQVWGGDGEVCLSLQETLLVPDPQNFRHGWGEGGGRLISAGHFTSARP